MSPKNDVAVVVVNYGSSTLLRQNLVALISDCPALTVVVVDNYTTSAERSAIRMLAEERGFHAVLLGDNRGFGAGTNAGVRRAIELGAQSFLILNPDAIVDCETVSRLASTVASQPMSLVSPVIYRPDGSIFFGPSVLDLDLGRPMSSRRADKPAGRYQPWLTAACLAVGKELWQSLGGFDEDYFLYWEDVDFSVRAHRQGAQLIVDESLLATHDEGGTQEAGGSTPFSDLYYYYNIRNRALFAAKNLPAPDANRWLRGSIREAREVLLRGGRRQFLRPWRPAMPALRGIGDGYRQARTTMRAAREQRPTRVRAARHKTVRVYETLRSAHLERARDYEPATIVYRARNYDFDDTMTVDLDLIQASSLRQLSGVLWRSQPNYVEINEPLMREGLQRTALTVLVTRLSNRIRRGHTLIVTYAIENLDPYGTAQQLEVKGLVRLSRDRILSRYVSRRVQRIVFGTPASEELYREELGDCIRNAESRMILALPAPCACVDSGGDSAVNRKKHGSVLFLGALTERKGFPAVCEAWTAIRRRVPMATLKIIGSGPGSVDAAELADSDLSISFSHDPPRDEIYGALREASVLVLFSQRTKRWREQIGLPILEGLQHGCRIVTTTETGLARWLADQGHEVLCPNASTSELVDAITRAMATGRSPAESMAELPREDGRRTADKWLMRPRSRGVRDHASGLHSV